MIVAVFWLSASAAWANGVLGLKAASDETWLSSSKFSPCQKNDDGNYKLSDITSCSQEDNQRGSFGGANASVVSFIGHDLLVYCWMYFILYKVITYYHALMNLFFCSCLDF